MPHGTRKTSLTTRMKKRAPPQQSVRLLLNSGVSRTPATARKLLYRERSKNPRITIKSIIQHQRVIAERRKATRLKRERQGKALVKEHAKNTGKGELEAAEEIQQMKKAARQNDLRLTLKYNKRGKLKAMRLTDRQIAAILNDDYEDQFGDKIHLADVLNDYQDSTSKAQLTDLNRAMPHSHKRVKTEVQVGQAKLVLYDIKRVLKRKKVRH